MKYIDKDKMYPIDLKYGNTPEEILYNTSGYDFEKHPDIVQALEIYKLITINIMKEKKKLQIAKACHNAHSVIAKNNGMKVIPWEDKSEEHKAVVINSIEKIVSGEIKSPEEAHENFVHMKEEFGWEFGPEYSTRFKTSPRLCDYEELTDVELQMEDTFFSVAVAFRK